MITPALHHRAERPSDAAAPAAVMDIAGARHEVLPPRRPGAAEPP